MNTLFYHTIYFIFTIYILIKSIIYGLYEINDQNNKIGGILTISFTIFSIIFSNIIVWQN